MVQFVPAEDVNALCEAILQLYKNPGQLKQLSAESDRFNQKYTWENIAGEYLGLVNQLSQ
jgi:glycosyltransferase involved in cell wall biosynthesis